MGISNPSLYLADRLDALRRTQNPDGGWAYYAGKASWLEPTALAALALHGQPEADRAWELIRGWQLPTGGWRPTKDVPGANWTSALAVLLTVVRGERPEKGLEWLGNSAKDGAWPWRRGRGAAEPTGLAMLALRRAGAPISADSEAFLLADMLTPETCGPALLGLCGSKQVAGLIPLATRWAEETTSSWTCAWIRLGLVVNGLPVNGVESAGETPLPRNLAIVALEALAASGGTHSLLGPGGVA